MYSDAAHTVLEIELPSFDRPVLFEVHRDGDLSSVQKQAVQKPIEWFLSRMTETERARLDRLLSGRVPDFRYVFILSMRCCYDRADTKHPDIVRLRDGFAQCVRSYDNMAIALRAAQPTECFTAFSDQH